MQDIRQIEEILSTEPSAVSPDEQSTHTDAPVALDVELLAKIGGGYTSAPNTTW